MIRSVSDLNFNLCLPLEFYFVFLSLLFVPIYCFTRANLIYADILEAANNLTFQQNKGLKKPLGRGFDISVFFS